MNLKEGMPITRSVRSYVHDCYQEVCVRLTIALLHHLFLISLLNKVQAERKAEREHVNYLQHNIGIVSVVVVMGTHSSYQLGCLSRTED